MADKPEPTKPDEPDEPDEPETQSGNEQEDEEPFTREDFVRDLRKVAKPES